MNNNVIEQGVVRGISGADARFRISVVKTNEPPCRIHFISRGMSDIQIANENAVRDGSAVRTGIAIEVNVK